MIFCMAGYVRTLYRTVVVSTPDPSIGELTLTRCIRRTKTRKTSALASFSPGQARRPTPKVISDWRWRLHIWPVTGSKNRSGLKASGSFQRAGSWLTLWILYNTRVHFGIVRPPGKIKYNNALHLEITLKRDKKVLNGV